MNENMNLRNDIIKTNPARISKFIFIWLVLLFNNASAQYKNDSVFNEAAISNIQLLNANSNKNIFLKANQNGKPLTLFVFLSPECPLCQNYSNKLNDLNKQYAGTVAMYGVIPGKAYSAGDIKKFIQQYNIQFPLLIDDSKKLTAYLQATVTPQAILLNDKNNLVYKGAIDDWAVSLGRQRVKTTKYFLRDAVQQSLSNNTVLIKRTKAVGCRINDY